MTARLKNTRNNADDGPDDDGKDWAVRVNSSVPDIEEAIEETAQDRVTAMLRDLRDTQTAKVRLYRMSQQSKKLGWCTDYTPEEFEAGGFESIRSMWGAGAYEIRVYGQTESGNHGVVGRSQIELMPLAAPVAGAANSELSQILARMAEQQAAQNTAILAALQNKPDPIAGMKETMGLMVMMREAMGLGASAAPQKSSIAEIIDAIKELKGASELLTPEKSEADPDNPLTMVPQIIELVRMAQQKNQTPEIVPFPLLHTPPGLSSFPAPLQAAIPNSQTPANSEERTVDSLAPLRASFARLIEIAEEFSGAVDNAMRATLVSDGAEFVYENLPDEFVEILRGENWFAALQMVAPEIGAHVEFFTRVRDAALMIFDEEGGLEDRGPEPTPLPQAL